VPVRKAQSSAGSPPVLVEPSQHAANPDARPAQSYDAEHQEDHGSMIVASPRVQETHMLAGSGPDLPDQSQEETSPGAGPSRVSDESTLGVKPNGRGKRFDPYTAGNSSRKIAKKQRSDPTPARLPAMTVEPSPHIVPYHAYSLPPASPSYSMPSDYSVNFVYPSHYPPALITENTPAQFSTFHPSQYYQNQHLVPSPTTPSSASPNYMQYSTFTSHPNPPPPPSVLPYAPQPQPPRRLYGHDRHTHDGRMTASLDVPRGQGIHQVPTNSTFTTEWKDVAGVPANNIPPSIPPGHDHLFDHHGMSHDHHTHPERTGVPQWSTIKGELRNGVLGG
jgi:hypothetical protein